MSNRRDTTSDFHISRSPWYCHGCGKPHRAPVAYYMPDGKHKFCDPECFGLWMTDSSPTMRDPQRPFPAAE